MEDLKEKASNLTDSITDYAKSTYQLVLLNAADKATGIAASTVAMVAVAVLGTFVLLFAGFALGIWLGGILNNAALGFLIVSAFFIVLIIIIVALRKNIVFPIVRDKLINKLYEPTDPNL